MTALEDKTLEFQKKGWLVVGVTDTTAQLRKPKRVFSCLTNLIWSLIGLVGIVLAIFGILPGLILTALGIIIPLWYFVGWALSREQMMTLTMDAAGVVRNKKRIV
jgi:hypothetical protein